ncbi:MAG: biotin/lipoyl-binding protein, partial [Alphaproteobacteria bacterium]
MEGPNPSEGAQGSASPHGPAPTRPKDSALAPPAAVRTHDRVVTPRKIMALAVIVLAVLGYGVFEWSDAWQAWLGLAKPPTALAVSGNIEAHQSVLGFKTVQSRVVELPFDEGQWVKAGTLIARLDDGDYRQQVAIAEA